MTPKQAKLKNDEAKGLIIRFFRRMFSDGEEWERFTLTHLGAYHADHKEGAHIQTYTPKHFKDLSPEKCGDMVFESIEDDRTMHNGMQRYLLLRHVKDYGEPHGRQIVDVLGRITSDPDGEHSVFEPATEQGLLAQLMRHQESTLRLATSGAQQTINNLTEQIIAKDQTISRLLEGHFRYVAAGEEFLDRKQERNFELDKKKRQGMMIEQGFAKALPLLMTVLSRLLPAGGQPMPVGAGMPGGVPSGVNGKTNGVHKPDDPMVVPLKDSYILTHSLIEMLMAKEELAMQVVPLFTPAEQTAFMEIVRIHTEVQGVPDIQVAQVSFMLVQGVIESLVSIPEKMKTFVGLLTDEMRPIFEKLYAVHKTVADVEQQATKKDSEGDSP